jgi:DNA mismatch repair protein MutL
MTIHRLAPDTVGKIAAGEVIERPAAAVKELLENALDAGPRRVDVTIAGGGVELLEVRDDGCGIPFADLPLAVERHATSKILAVDDLRSLTTLGFRGEALASLGAVSDLRIRTIAAGESAGGALDVHFGNVGSPRPTAWGAGTSICARDLFANVPARRSFLRQPQTESTYVTRIVAAYALAYPEVAFSLEIDGRQSFATDGAGDPLGAAVAVWGAEVADAMLTLATVDDAPEGYRIGGIVSHPSLDRSTRQQQYLFAQGRLVTNRQLAVAFEQAYHTLLMVGRHPVGCIVIRVPPDRIDVNVHPTKAEVRFADDRLVFGLVQRAVRETLIGRVAPAPVPTIVSSPLIDQTVQRRLALAHPQFQPVMPQFQPDDESVEPDPRRPAGGRALPVLRVLGQVAATFIVAEGPDGMYLIDQHAAHERIVFERLMAASASRSPDRQTLLQGVVVELTAAEWTTLVAARDELASFGFEIDALGSSTVVVRAVPAQLDVRDPERVLRLILDELLAGGRGQSRHESLAISAACHTSIRAGQALSLLEMRELVVQLEQCSSPMACGHGRPTMLRMTAADLERQFSRR